MPILTASFTDVLFATLFSIQFPAAVLVIIRLMKAAYQHTSLESAPLKTESFQLPASQVNSVSVLVPTLNEVDRLGPCLAGLTQQGPEVAEILVIDSHSQDGTRDLVRQFQQQDQRIKLLTDSPLPAGWVGRPWALQFGFLQSAPQSEWILGIDADTKPQPGLVQRLLAKAQASKYDLLSLSPQFIMRHAGESWLHPALLTTLLYRTDSLGTEPDATQRVLANGQCFLCRRDVLSQVGGYASARYSFCDDVTLARHIASAGFKVGMLDGATLLKVRMYEGATETWYEWGRSLDLKDACSKAQLHKDLYLLVMAQALPLPLLVALVIGFTTSTRSVAGLFLLGLNSVLLILRLILLGATAHCYDRSQAQAGWLFWLSPLLDPVAVLRIFLSAFQVPTHWRGRTYFSPLTKPVSP